MDIHDGLRFQCVGLELVMVQIITTQLNCHISAMHGKNMVAVMSGTKRYIQIRHKTSDNKDDITKQQHKPKFNNTSENSELN